LAIGPYAHAAAQALAHVISPKELQAFLIKPVQRICKYPLLLGSLSKVTPFNHKHYQALLDGLAATKRITDTVNNAQRQQENEVVFEALMTRLKDWKGVPISQHAPLLLDDLFAVSSDQNGSGEYHVFLFERLIILCVPAPPDAEKKATERGSVFKRSASSNALNLQAQASAFLAEGVVMSRKATTQLVLKGALYIRSFEDLETIETGWSISFLVTLLNFLAGACSFRFRNTGEQPHCVYTFHCTNSEKMNQWHSEIKRQSDRWQKEKEEQRTHEESRLNVVYGERPTYEQVDSSHDSLDFMRSAPRPKHPYESDFRPRSRTNSRVHSRSVGASSARDGDASVISDEPEAIVTRRGGTAAYSMPPERDHIEVLAQSGAIEALRARSQTQDGSSFILWRNQILPPQPPPPQLPQPPIPTPAIYFPSTSVRKLPERRLRSRQRSTGTLASAESDSSSNHAKLTLGVRRPSVPDLPDSPLYPVPTSGGATGREPRERESRINPMSPTSTLGVPAQPRVRSHSNPNVQPIPSHPYAMDYGVQLQTAGRSTTNVSQYQPPAHSYDDKSGRQSHRKRNSGSSFDSAESSDVYGGRSSPLTPFSSREGSSLCYPGNTASPVHPYAAPPLPTALSGQKVHRPPNLRLASCSSDIHMGAVTPPSATFPGYQQVPVPAQSSGSPGPTSGLTSTPTTPTSSRLHITVHYGTDHKFTLGFLTTTPFEEVVDKMRKKIRICTSSGANGPLRMYYGDDMGGRTLLRTTEDYRGALEAVMTRLARGNQTSPGSLVVWVQPDI